LNKGSSPHSEERKYRGPIGGKGPFQKRFSRRETEEKREPKRGRPRRDTTEKEQTLSEGSIRSKRGTRKPREKGLGEKQKNRNTSEGGLGRTTASKEKKTQEGKEKGRRQTNEQQEGKGITIEKKRSFFAQGKPIVAGKKKSRLNAAA